jgi:TonB family protein
MSFLTRFFNLFRRDALNREFEDELSFHVERRIERHIQAGMSRAEAEAKAHQEFGNLTRAKQGMQEVRVMRTSVAVAALISVSLCVAAGTWFWLRSTGFGVPAPAYYQIGDEGVTPPSVIRERKPDYPDAAKQARIQGSIVMECIVQPTGICDDVQIAQSLDPVGLDREAIRAIQEWRFRPGTRMGEPVPVKVNVEFSFTLR